MCRQQCARHRRLRTACRRHWRVISVWCVAHVSYSLEEVVLVQAVYPRGQKSTLLARCVYIIEPSFPEVLTFSQGSTIRNTLCTAYPNSHAYSAYPVWAPVYCRNTQPLCIKCVSGSGPNVRMAQGQKRVILQIHAKIHHVAPSIAVIAPSIALLFGI